MTARDRLVEAAADLLWRDGYTAMSPAALQRQARAGQGSMYHHFAGKADVARAGIELNAATVRGAADEVLGGVGPALGRVVAYLERERDPMRGCPVGRLAHDERVLGEEGLRRPLAELFAGLESDVRALLDQAEVAEPADVAATVVAVVQGGYTLARAAGERAPYDRAVSGAVALLRNATRKG